MNLPYCHCFEEQLKCSYNVKVFEFQQLHQLKEVEVAAWEWHQAGRQEACASMSTSASRNQQDLDVGYFPGFNSLGPHFSPSE